MKFSQKSFLRGRKVLDEWNAYRSVVDKVKNKNKSVSPSRSTVGGMGRSVSHDITEEKHEV